MNMTRLRRLIGAMAGTLIALNAWPAAAQDTDFVEYVVQPNDTFYDLAKRYLVNAQSGLEVQRINGIRNARRLPINRTLRIPRRLLDTNDVVLTVAFVSGDVQIDGARPAQGDRLGIGDQIMTGRNGFVTFGSSFGGTVSIPSNTHAELQRAVRYKLYNALDVDFKVHRGRARTISPQLESNDRLRMRTPVAVTAVRGTDFRIGFDPEANDASLTEVTEGAVNVAAGSEARDAAAGFGIASTADGVSAPEKLLPAAVVLTDGALQTGETLQFAITPVDGATGYRVQLANDVSFLDVIGETVIDGETVELPGIDNGRYHIRARAIAVSGLEGNQESLSFLRKRVGASASAETSPSFDGYKFGWVPEGSGNTTFAFQLWREGDPERLLVDELGLSVTEIALTDLPPGRFQWRVAAIESDPEFGLIKVWGAPQTLVVVQ